MTNRTFSEVIQDEFTLLAQYTPILARVHGENHPELAQVRDVFATMNDKVKEYGANEVQLTEEFTKLRDITSNYTVPSDGCETYAATYEMMERADNVYHS